MTKHILLTAVGEPEHIGDNIMKLSMLEPISKNFPDSVIVVCCKYPEVFKYHPLVFKVIDGSKILNKEEAQHILKKEKFDLVIETSIYGHQHFYIAALEMNQAAILSTHQQFRDILRKIFIIPPPPYTDGEIPIVLPKTDEYVFSLRVNGFNVNRRYFPQLIVPKKTIEHVANKLIKEGFDYRKDTFILCENASDPAREWGVENFIKLGKLLSKNNSQLIITSTAKNKTLEPYLRLKIDKKQLFMLDTNLEEFFALLSINMHFRLNVVKGVIAGDTGALHAACAVNNILPHNNGMVIICLGHEETSGDIRYSQPGSVYVARLKPRWDKRLEEMAEHKLNMHWHQYMEQLLGMPYEIINIDLPKETKYLAQPISSNPIKMPIFTGNQIYTHTLLRNILENNEPFGAKGPLYRRMDVKKIEPEAVYEILKKELLKQHYCPHAVHGSDKAERIETAFIAQEFLKDKQFATKTLSFYMWPKHYMESSRHLGEKLSIVWDKLSFVEKIMKFDKLLDNLRSMHEVKFNKFGKFGLCHNWLFDSWPAYFKAVLEKKIKLAVKKKTLKKDEISAINKFIIKNIPHLHSKEACLVHHDIKLENIIVHGENMGLIDFEYATSAPIDYELDTLLRYFIDPEMYTHHALLKKDLILVKRGVLDFYPELIEFPNINERLSLYSLKFYIDMLILGKHKEESKTRIQEILNGKVYFEV